MSHGDDRAMAWAYLGRLAYAPALALQEDLRRRLKDEACDDHLLLLEHEPVYTLGRNADRTDIVADDGWLARNGVAIHKTNRGGQVTYHGPGQLVGYPIFDLNPDRRDIRRYVHALQEVLIRVLADFGVDGWRREGKDYVGVWVGSRSTSAKIASIGVHLSRWITMHGFALNVTTDLALFGGIVACGLPDVRMTSIAEQSSATVSVPDVAARVAHHAGAVFERRLYVVDDLTPPKMA